MQLTIIGCWSPYPRVNEACSGYLVRNGSTSILLDCGHGVASSLGNYIEINELDAVVISHYHPDHYADLYAIRHYIRSMIYKKRRKAPLQVYLPPQPKELFDYFSSLPEFSAVKITAGVIEQVKGLRMEFFDAIHSIPGFSIKICNEEKSIFYSGDTALGNDLYKNTVGADVVLLESTLCSSDNHTNGLTGHMTAREAAQCALQSEARIFIATHLYPEYDLDNLKKEIDEVYSKDYYIASSGLTVNI